MESTGGSSGSTMTAAAAMPSPSVVADSSRATNYEFDPSIKEEERRFYLKAYPTVDVVRERKTHCTVCKVHIGTAPVQEHGIKMHPILRVTHCNKCHDFYNSGEFSKGEDGSELYCRWCGQGGEVYCCSSCPYVFCKSCIVKNLSRGVVADIEQNENWNCFSCAPKILWPLRAQHWALMNYIEQQKKEIYALNLSEAELKVNLSKDRSRCCRLAKSKCGNMSDSMESLDSLASKRSHGSATKKPIKHSATPSPQQINAAKRAKTNDEVVCTPDLLSMLEPDCQITVSPKPNRPMTTPSASTPKIMSIQQPQAGYGLMSSTPKSSAPPPLVLRNTAIKLRPAAPPPVVRRTIIGPRTPNPGGNGTPVYHTINGYRIDLNSAAQQETFRLPNGKLIQVKRQGPPTPQNASPSANNWQRMSSPQPQRVIPQTIASRPVQITQHPYNISVQHHPQVLRYNSSMIGSTTINPVNHNGTTIQVLNGQMTSQSQPPQQQQQQVQQSGPVRPVMVRHVFPDNTIGHARNGLQDQVFNAMEICTHLTNKVQTLTNSNAYKQARNFLEVKELYIHLSYLLTYAIGRFKSLQDKCLGDMRTLGFGNDADCLENGQLAAAVDYVCYGQLDDVDLFNTGSNSFHNQVYEYRKSLHANLKEGEDGAKSPLPPIFSLGQAKSEDVDDDIDGEDSLLEEPKALKGHWLEGGDDSPAPPSYNQENEENEEPEESYMDNDDDDTYNRSSARGAYGDSLMQGTEESMKKNEESYVHDRKLTRLVSQYPSIWCTRHPDYGNFEVTRKQWRTIASHFDGNEHIKLRWKNIRKRFVRIEKRIAEGKRFNGHFDKAMAFLANRDLPEDQWVPVDCGEDDGDTFSRYNLDAIEQSLHIQGKDENVDRTREPEKEKGERNLFNFQPAIKPIEVEPLDLRIITFVKSNPVIWRKSMDPEADKIDDETRRTVWKQLQRCVPHIPGDYIKDRWQHLYEMYKTFRLKTIKSIEDRSNLELKYSKYLAKLYFLYKIDEEELRNENNGLFEDCFELEDDEEETAHETEDQDSDEEPKKENQTKLQDMPDDKEFLLELVKLVREYPAIWNTQHNDYNDIMVRDSYWQEINEKLQDFKHKQASDDEDNEIEIVEPKTDLITLDSDDDEPPPSTPIKTQHPIAQIKTQHKAYSSPQHSVDVKIKPRLSPASLAQASRPVVAKSSGSLHNTSQGDDNMDLMSMAQSFLASMLEVDIHEGPLNSPGSDSSAQKKQPRKKLTNKPNPTLLKQKALMQLERLEEMKRNDQKLKMKCAVELKKAEEVYPYAKEMLEAKAKEKQEYEEAKNNKLQQQAKKLTDETEKVTVEVIMDDDAMNSSTEETNKTETKDTIKTNTTTIEKEEEDTEASVEITEKNNDKTEDDEENIAEKETSMEISEKETCEEIQDKSTENIAENEISTETTEKETSVEIQNEIKDKSTENIAENDIPTETTEKETSVEIIDNIEDTTTEDILQKEEEEHQDVEDKEAEVKSNDHADDDDKKENKNTIEPGAILETIENSKNDDTEENKANGVTNEDKIQEDMEIDEIPPGTPTQDECMDNDEDEKAQESPQTSLTTDDMETNNTKPDEKLDIVHDREKVSPPQEDNDNDKNIDKENENVVPQKKANDEDENMNESEVIGNENQLSSPTKETLTSPKNCEVEEPSTKPTTTASTEIESDKDTVKDLANTEETIKTNPSAAEDIPSKKQTIETPATEIEATTSSNGNI